MGPYVPWDTRDLVARIARENRSWGYRRIADALANLGIELAPSTIARILSARGIPPAPDRRRTTTWKQFLKAHGEVLAAADFFTAKVWTLRGLVSYHVLFVVKIASRTVHIAGVTTSPHEGWMLQSARNLTMAGWGFLEGIRLLLHDRDRIFTPAFRRALHEAGVETLRLPRRSPNLNAFAERWVRSVKEECLSKLVLLGERSLRRALDEYLVHFHQERNHQGLAGRIPHAPPGALAPSAHGRIRRRPRLGGLLNYYYRKAG